MDKEKRVSALRVRFDNVDFNSTSGPNNFAFKLASCLNENGVEVNLDQSPSDLQLSFIQSNYEHEKTVQRLDGIYFNSEQDWLNLNRPISLTYEKSAAVIFQSEFNKKLTEKYFGHHPHGYVIHNGTNENIINSISPLEHPALEKFHSVWCCASSWRPHKRLKENIKYFLDHSTKEECLVVAGHNADYHVRNDRIFYVGNLDWISLISLFKRSKYFIHLALMDHCPNVVVDARASDCHIICTDSGGTKEVAGLNATVIKDMEWDFKPFKLYSPPDLDFTLKYNNALANTIDIVEVTKKYIEVFKAHS